MLCSDKLNCGSITQLEVNASLIIALNPFKLYAPASSFGQKVFNSILNSCLPRKRLVWVLKVCEPSSIGASQVYNIKYWLIHRRETSYSLHRHRDAYYYKATRVQKWITDRLDL